VNKRDDENANLLIRLREFAGDQPDVFEIRRAIRATMAILSDEGLELLRASARHELRARKVGRPQWPTWDAMIAAREQIQAEGGKGTQAEVAERLNCGLRTVKDRAQANGGWLRAEFPHQISAPFRP
jgi:hypothetical protein